MQRGEREKGESGIGEGGKEEKRENRRKGAGGTGQPDGAETTAESGKNPRDGRHRSSVRRQKASVGRQTSRIRR